MKTLHFKRKKPGLLPGGLPPTMPPAGEWVKLPTTTYLAAPDRSYDTVF